MRVFAGSLKFGLAYDNDADDPDVKLRRLIQQINP